MITHFKRLSQYHPPPPHCPPIPPLSAGWGDNFQSEILKRAGGGGDQKKNECLGVFKSLCNRYLLSKLTMFLVKKDFIK